MKYGNKPGAVDEHHAADHTDLDPAEKSHFRLCHFCYYLNESPIAVSRCRRCQKPLRNPNDSEQLYQQIVSQLEDTEDEDAGEQLIEGLTELLSSGDPRTATDSFDEDEEDEERAGMQGVIDEVLPLNGLSVVW